MNKEQMDIQLIEACLLEKWFPMREGTFESLGQDVIESCALCQIYNAFYCVHCPINEKVNKTCCYNTPYEQYIATVKNSPERAQAIIKMCKFLVSLLPPSHPWRTNEPT